MESIVLFLGIALAIWASMIIKNKKKILNQCEEKIESAKIEVRSILGHGEREKRETIESGRAESLSLVSEAERKVRLAEDRIERLKSTDTEISARLKQARELIESITDESCRRAAMVELIADEDLLESQIYQDDRKEIRKSLKKLATNAFIGADGINSNVNIGKFVAISAKADMAGALLLTTAEMLCLKITINNGHASIEKLQESIIATEALIQAIDHRARISPDFKEALEKRIVVEINNKKAKQKSREEQQAIREQEREERKVREEAEKIQRAAEYEEEIKNKAIQELQERMKSETDEMRSDLVEQLAKLQEELAEAHNKAERAKSRAQETKQGHVYIISNIGSFGKDILKIGMTRRLNPLDRVKELGDASVPFLFDVHALIECDDAPKLENELHKLFEHKRVNKVNYRKEFFRVTIDEIETELQRQNIHATINKVASADQYYQSIKKVEIPTTAD